MSTETTPSGTINNCPYCDHHTPEGAVGVHFCKGVLDETKSAKLLVDRKIDLLARFLYDAMMGRMETRYKWPRINPINGVRFTWDNENDDCREDWRHVASLVIGRDS